ncbi:phosphotransferase [Candidatus Gracilibacteria bacterium]|nr:phosphotransferase [Candidatus Gracilibacteria bacterium]
MTRKNETRIVGGKWMVDDEEESEARPRKPRSKSKSAGVVKQSYESNPDVQRWLSEQAIGEGRKAPFQPNFLAGRRDGDWVLSSLNHFYEQDLICDVISEVKSGKEATVFCCTADPSTGVEFMAAKIYRPRIFRALSNDAIYREGRVARDMDGRVVRGGRGVPGRATQKGRAFQIESWIAFEYATQQAVYAARVTTPQPFSQIGNGILMEFVGTPEDPAPRICEIAIDGGIARRLYDELLEDVRRSLLAHRIHGDLSAYNILFHNDRAVVIDFAQAVDPRLSQDAFDLLLRDVARLCSYFAPYGVRANPHEIATALWEEYLQGT